MQSFIFLLKHHTLLTQKPDMEDNFIYVCLGRAIEKYSSNFTYVAQAYTHANGIYIFRHLLLVVTGR